MNFVKNSSIYWITRTIKHQRDIPVIVQKQKHETSKFIHFNQFNFFIIYDI